MLSSSQISPPSRICVCLGNIKRIDVLKLLRQELFCELRLDLIPEIEPLEELLSAGAKCVVTCRDAKHFSAKQKEKLLLRACDLKAYAIDLELEASAELKTTIRQNCEKNSVKFILSHHDFEKTPAKENLQEIRELAFSEHADIFKLATQIQNQSDLTTLFSLLEDDRNQIVIGMGDLGKVSRAIAPYFGSLFSYVAPVSVNDSAATAPGQLSSLELQEVWKILGSPW